MASEAHAFDVSLKEQKEIADVYAKLRQAGAKLIGSDAKAEILPTNPICIPASPVGRSTEPIFSLTPTSHIG